MSSWTDYYLKFNDMQNFAQSIPSAWHDGDGGILCTEEHVADVFGFVVHPDTGLEAPGYHVNLRLRHGVSLPASFAAFVIDAPLHPHRVFA